ncbi:DUF1214 domain-containing protein [Bradyrhizobium sp. AZCC 1588]|uniref:DUF1214 domain-containing protein n=1 Tax=unclassified Bradyrhizobium TaxID=2631580 RepID=UPI003FA5E857
MYQITPEGQFYFVDNPINRYTIGDRTPGLRRGADGSIDIWMSRSEPSTAPNANWLPTPADGNFTVLLRAYLPKPSLVEGRYELPITQGM